MKPEDRRWLTMLHLANVCLYTAGIDDEMLELALADKIRQTVADFIDAIGDQNG